MQYTKYLICPFIDLEFCSQNELKVITGNQHENVVFTFEFDHWEMMFLYIIKLQKISASGQTY